jgi:predicted secreted hydrolase
MLRLASIILAVALLLGTSYWLLRPEPDLALDARVSVAEAMSGDTSEGFARATAPRDFAFPADHGPHPEFQTEWWYYTGNLSSADGRQFGFQLTFFRRALTPAPVARDSSFAASQVYLAHFALSDIDGAQFHGFDRLARGAAGLAGAQGTPFRVWLEDWEAAGIGAQDEQMRLRARQGDVAIDLALDAAFKPPVLQGERGLSQKSAESGNASYYYSLTRMPARGTVRVGGSDYAVSGLAWMDREWSTSALGAGQVGWDWFALQLDDGRDLMYYQVRRSDGSADPLSKGTLVAADGSAAPIRSADATLTPQGSWRSPRSGASYPAAWRLQIPSQGLDLTITPKLADQELPLSIVYWEGAVSIAGTANGNPITGNGYLEMTGYGDSQGEDGQQSRTSS